MHHMREVIRFSVLFAILELLPVTLLAVFALRSIEAEELTFDRGLQERAEAIVSHVERQLEDSFLAFERNAEAAMKSGDADVQRLVSQFPPLRGTFRLDGDGRLIAPFAPPDDDRAAEPTANYTANCQLGRRFEHDENHEAAAAAYALAEAASSDSDLVAEARYLRGRSLRHVDPAAAEAIMEDLAAATDGARERHGFLISDLATLTVAEIMTADGRGAIADQRRLQLVERSLTAPWTIGRPESNAPRKALELLEDVADPGWHNDRMRRLLTRAERLDWAREVGAELKVLAGRSPSAAGFTYHPEKRALWATVWRKNNLYVFSFAYGDLERMLRSSAITSANEIDPDLAAALVRSGEDVGPGLVRRTLAPKIPSVAILVRPTDPGALERNRLRTRQSRAAIILVAVMSAGLGMVLTVRIVNGELESARTKADFAANVSHELRSPITQIRLKGESLQLGLCYDDDDRQAHYDAIVRESERLSRLVDNVLDFASIERGVKSYTLRPEDLGDILTKAMEAGRETVEAAGMTLEADIPDDLPVVWVDREAVGQIATNLLSNAVKYGSDGEWIGVVARVGLDGVDVAFQDRGIGISKDDQRRIFEDFYRVKSNDVRKKRGTGIGLAIVRYIVEAHGGAITVDSQLGVGTTFTVTFPFQPPTAAGA